ncbi:MAG: hypothetical protein E6J06_01985 [Chloroflexi bacterium]|nr:MAG: hypothetical protein E6J06_01985 [Chloroflexota bacterium]
MIWACVLPISTAKCFMKSLQAVDEVPAAVSEAAPCCADPEGSRLKLMPEADAVMAMAAPATATAPRARPAMRTGRAFRRLVMVSITHTPGHTVLMVL